jgi:hypothetical protein
MAVWASWKIFPPRWGISETTSAATSAWNSVGTSSPRLGEARRA